MRRLRQGMVGCALLSIGVFAASAFAAPGDLDSSFGVGGRVVFELGDASVSPSDMLLQSDGKIVALAATPSRVDDPARDLLVARFDSDGSLDLSFNRLGYKLMAVNGQYSLAGGLARQSDGKLIVSGATRDDSGDTDFIVARLNVDGSFDSSFGTAGWATISFGGVLDRAWRTIVQPDGNIIVAGVSNASGPADFAFARLTANGALDGTFGIDGKVLVDSPLNATDTLVALLLQSDGKIVAAGSAQTSVGTFTRPFMVRLNSNGSLDGGFADNGRFLLDITPFLTASINDIVQQSDGRILAGGYVLASGGTFPATMRLAANGSIDAPIALLDTGGYTGSVVGVLAESGGQFLVSGTSARGPLGIITRFTSFGVPDLTFSADGSTFIDVGDRSTNFNFVASRLARQADGRIVVLGVGLAMPAPIEQTNRRSLMLARLGPSNGSPGTIGLSGSGTELVNEGALSTFSVVRSGGATGAVSVTYALVPVTATEGQDFPSLTGTLTWNDGETGAKSVGFVPVSDGLYEPIQEEFQIELSGVTGGAASATTVRRVFIRSLDPPAGPRVTLDRPSVEKYEDSQSTNVNVTFTGWNLAGVTSSVDYSVILGTAADGLDVVASSGTIVLTDSNGGSISIPTIADATDEAIKTFTIRLSNPTGGVTIDRADTVVSLMDNDPPPFVELKESSTSVSEAATSVTLTVTRTAHAAGELAVDFATQAATATSSDFVPVSGTLLWAANDYTPKTITVGLTPDAAAEGNESFSVVLTNPTIGAVLGHSAASITIVDDDAPPLTTPAPSGGGGSSGGGGGPLDLLSLLACAAALMRRRHALRLGLVDRPEHARSDLLIEEPAARDRS